MAGHRRKVGKPTRATMRRQRSAARFDQRIQEAVTPEERLAARFDAFRSACVQHPDRALSAIREAERQLASLTAWVTGRGEAA